MADKENNAVLYSTFKEKVMDDILGKIFYYTVERRDWLSVALVCKRWNDVLKKSNVMDFTADSCYALLFYVKKDDIPKVRSLLKDKRIDPLVRGSMIIAEAFHGKHHAILDSLLRDERIKELYSQTLDASNGRWRRGNCPRDGLSIFLRMIHRWMYEIGTVLLPDTVLGRFCKSVCEDDPNAAPNSDFCDMIRSGQLSFSSVLYTEEEWFTLTLQIMIQSYHTFWHTNSQISSEDRHRIRTIYTPIFQQFQEEKMSYMHESTMRSLIQQIDAQEVCIKDRHKKYVSKIEFEFDENSQEDIEQSRVVKYMPPRVLSGLQNSNVPQHIQMTHILTGGRNKRRRIGMN